MLNFPWLPNRDELCRRFATISRLAGEGRFAEVLEATREAEAACAVSGVPTTPFILWSRAVAEDSGGSLSVALEYILKAVRADPVDGTINHSLDIIVNKVRGKLLGTPWDDSAVAMYAALAEEDLVDDGLRVAYAASLLAAEKCVDALRVAQAVAALNPRNSKAWRIVQAAAEKLGDHALAAEAANSAAAASLSIHSLKPNVPLAAA